LAQVVQNQTLKVLLVAMVQIQSLQQLLQLVAVLVVTSHLLALLAVQAVAVVATQVVVRELQIKVLLVELKQAWPTLVLAVAAQVQLGKALQAFQVEMVAMELPLQSVAHL
jgi:hypothetical protein